MSFTAAHEVYSVAYRDFSVNTPMSVRLSSSREKKEGNKKGKKDERKKKMKKERKKRERER